MKGRIHTLQLGSPTGLYGAERWILALIRHLDTTEVRSSVAVVRDDPDLEAPLCDEARASGFDAWRLDAPGRINLSAIRKVRNLLLEQGVHVLHTHGYKTDLIGLLAVRGTSCRIVTTPHGWSTQAGWKLRLYEALDRAVFPMFDAVVPLSDKLHGELSRIPGLSDKLRLVRNGVDISEIRRSQSIADTLRKWKSQGDLIIGYIGQLIPRKGLDVLIEAFARWDFPRKRLVLVGDGPQREVLEALVGCHGVGDRVLLTGFREDRLDWLRGFDVFVLPSRLEGIPRCLMEAMAANVPIVASDIPGCRDLIANGTTGLLVAPDNMAALAATLGMMTDPALRSRMAESARLRVVEEFSAERMAREYQELYAKLVSA